jgi:hypothetical protein
VKTGRPPGKKKRKKKAGKRQAAPSKGQEAMIAVHSEPLT